MDNFFVRSWWVLALRGAAGMIRHRRSEDDWWLVMLLGLVSIGAGVVAVTRPALTVLVMVMAANALVIGSCLMTRIQRSTANACVDRRIVASPMRR